MEKICLELYERMLVAIDCCIAKFGCNQGYIECCFAQGEKIVNELEHAAANYTFSNKKEEIWYYKSVKPRFYALIEFFSLLYKGELFIKYEVDHLEYWKNEIEYIRRFFIKHETFYQYYKTGMTHLDEDYFLDEHSQTKLVASLIAREKYLAFVEEKLRLLQTV